MQTPTAEALKNWHTPLHSLISRGARAERPGSLAGLAAARQEHLGQFFTPLPLVEFLWRVVAPAMAKWEQENQTRDKRKLVLFDNACGIGRMFWPADPERHALCGADVDTEAVRPLIAAAEAAGFSVNLHDTGMENIVGGQADVGFLNPPFSITLQSPNLTPTDGVTTWGPYGEHSQAVSQFYAIAQALDVCEVVLAVVPLSFVEATHRSDVLSERLRAVIELPRGQFREEGTDVGVAVVVYGSQSCGQAERFCVASLDEDIPDLGLTITYRPGRKPLKRHGIEDSHASITTPVTGDARVRVAHDGRKIIVKFACGLVEAKVRNALLKARASQSTEKQRLPKGVRYVGQGVLDLENLLFVADPYAAFEGMLAVIRRAGGVPDVDPGLERYFDKRIRSDKIRRTPFRRWAWLPGQAELSQLPTGQTVDATVTKTHVTNPKIWGSPVLMAGQPVSVTPLEGAHGREYEIRVQDSPVARLALEQAIERVNPNMPAHKGWRLIHPGRREAFPAVAEAIAERARAMGIDRWLHWGSETGETCYQFDDMVELLMAPSGCCGWTMGLGKTRLAVALALMGGAHNLIVVESHLVPDFERELAGLPIDQESWQVIRRPEQADTLRKINVISYARLRRPVTSKAGRRTYAARMRRRLHTVVADEAHLVRNRGSAQCQALWALSPKRRYGLTGTAIANYCRDARPLLVWAGGDGCSYQPYGEFHPYVDSVNINSMGYSRRGMDVFRERFVSLEWTTNEFADDLRSGAKREVARLRNVETFRAMLAPHVLRRVENEPEVARWVSIPEATKYTHTVGFDDGHLRAYLETAFEFAKWYRQRRVELGACGLQVNLVALLARIGEVFKAANAPQTLNGPTLPWCRETSKDRKALSLVERFVKEGRKTIVFATKPITLTRLGQRLAERGIEAVVYTGQVGVTKRTHELNTRFRCGPVPVLLATLGAAQTGLNLPEASRVIFYNRDWTPKTEAQALHRVLRPQQRDQVEAHYLHLKGSIDVYQAQMCDQKANATHAGLDYGEQDVAEGEFLHIDTILGRFCEDLVEQWGAQSARDLVGVLSERMRKKEAA